MRIVIVEDHPMILQVLTAALAAIAEYTVEGHSSAAAGIAACRNGADLAIFDYRLPDMTGTDAVMALRNDALTRHLPIIMITGDNDARTRLEAIKAGATDFLQKPVNIDEFRLRVRNLLALHDAQKTSEEREKLLETVISAAGACIAVADARSPETPILFASDALAKFTGRHSHDLIGKDPLQFLQEDTGSPVLRDIEAAITARQSGSCSIELKRPDGARSWTQVTLRPVPDAGKQARFLVITLSDISDMVEIRAAHDKLAARMSDIARISGAWFFEIDATCRLSYVSEAMATALGASADLVQGIHVDRLGGRFASPARKDQPLSTLFGASFHAVENELLTFRLRDGQVRAVQVSIVPFKDAEGQFAGYRGYAGDVSDIAQARDAAARASRAKSAFLATMSHEMRTPLTAIMGMSELLMRDCTDPDQHVNLGMITDAAMNLSDVLGNLLDVAIMESGTLGLNTAEFDPVLALDRAMRIHRQDALAKGLSFDCRVDGAARGVRLGDGARVRQIIHHLLSNAVKFTPQGSVCVVLDLHRVDALTLTVTDTGIGMRPEELEAAFQPFLQADDGIARRYGGSGLGLSIARWLSNAMNGSLQLDSQIGKGSTATLTLPLPQTGTTHPEEGDIDLNGHHVLVADDNRANRKILDVILRKMGADVTLCADGQEAIGLWKTQPFDLLLLDINMPEVAGTDVMRNVREAEAQRAAPPVPALAVTANAMPDQVAHYLEVGFDGCVGKPFTRAALTTALRHVLHHS
ncbi:response regulator [Roseinatronobacter sp. NSM]|uniref:response regulator n=1 Tax=Roseinatronobacter sp. NSM TaxID=3457785 RepID=UPI004035BB2D